MFPKGAIADATWKQQKKRNKNQTNQPSKNPNKLTLDCSAGQKRRGRKGN